MEMKVNVSSFTTKKFQAHWMQHDNFTIEMAKGVILAYMLGKQLSFKIQPLKN
jgi:hypothetical protein